MSKKNKGARMQKAERNAAEKVMFALSGTMPKPGPGRKAVLRHGNTFSFEEEK